MDFSMEPVYYNEDPINFWTLMGITRVPISGSECPPHPPITDSTDDDMELNTPEKQYPYARNLDDAPNATHLFDAPAARVLFDVEPDIQSEGSSDVNSDSNNTTNITNKPSKFLCI